MKSEKLTKRDVEGVGAVLIAAILIFGFIIWPDILPTEIGSYPARRLVDGDLITLNRTVYKVNPLMQTIVYWWPGIDETPYKLVDCAVRDRKNWVGYYPDGSGTVEMRKGRIVKDDPNEIHIGRCHWWLLQFGILRK